MTNRTRETRDRGLFCDDGSPMDDISMKLHLAHGCLAALSLAHESTVDGARLMQRDISALLYVAETLVESAKKSADATPNPVRLLKEVA